MGPTALFALQDVGYRRGGRVVLDGLGFEIQPGSTALVGPSGAGKSTLLRLLNRLADPAAGTVRYRGRDLRELEVLGLRREVALVPQLPALLPGTVAENLAYGPSLCERGCQTARALVLAGLDESFAERSARELSVGEQQRVGIARAVVSKPPLLIADEPTGNLDPDLSLEVMRLFRRFQDVGVTVVIASHDHTLVREFGQRVIVLENGQVQGTAVDPLPSVQAYR